MRAILTPIRPITDTFMRVLGTNLFKDVLGFTKESLGGLFDFLGKQRAEKKRGV